MSALGVAMSWLLVASVSAEPKVIYLNVADDQTAGEPATAKARAAAASQREPVLDDPALLKAAEAPLQTRGVAFVARERAAAMLRSATEAYRSLDLSAALQWQREGVSLLELDAAPADETFRLLADLWLIGGLAYEANGQKAKALDAFKLSYRLAKYRQHLDAAQYQPSVVDLYDEAVRADSKATGTLTVSAPAAARLRLDGVTMSAREAVPASAGEHYLTIDQPGFGSKTQRVTVKAAAALALTVSLLPRPLADELAALRTSARESPSAADAAAKASALDAAAVVFVREGPGGWVTTRVELARLSTPPLATGTPPDWAVGQPATVAPAATAATPWYRSWWGISAMVGGALIIGGTVAIVATRPAPETTYSINKWCGPNC